MQVLSDAEHWCALSHQSSPDSIRLAHKKPRGNTAVLSCLAAVQCIQESLVNGSVVRGQTQRRLVCARW